MGKNRIKDSLKFIILFIITLLIVIYSIYLWIISYEDGTEKILNYNEELKVDYKVYLKENEFYNQEYLTEEYNIIASAIETIDIDFNYILNLSNNVQGQSQYKVNAKIIAYQKIDEKKVWDNNQSIKDEIITLYETDTTNINQNDSFKINYQDYKKLMADYQKNYGVSLIGQLVIEINIDTELEYNEFNNNIQFNNRKATITTSLTDPIINIKKDIPDYTKETKIIEKSDPRINYLKLILSIISFTGGILLSTYLGKILVTIFGYNSEYVRKLSKIMKTYNSVIVDVEEINLNKYENKLTVKSFDELLDAQFELRIPIYHSTIKKNNEDLFTIKHNNDLIMYRMKSNLYDKKGKKWKQHLMK